MNADLNVKRFGKPHRRRSLIASAAYSLVITLSLSLAMLFLLAFAAYRSEDPTRLIVSFSVGTLALSSFVCGLSGARFRRSQGLVAGLLSGFAFALLVALVSFAFAGVEAPDMDRTYLLYAAIPMLAAFGGIVGCARKESKPRRRRH